MTDPERTTRALCRRIDRLRRRIDGRVRNLQQQANRLVDWSMDIRLPGWMTLAQMLAGLFASPRLGRRMLRRLGLLRFRRQVQRAILRLWRQFRRVWAASFAERKPQPPAADGGGHAGG